MKNNKQPEIRFNGFHDEWKDTKLGAIADSFEYGLNASAKQFDGINKYIRITDIDDDSHKFLQKGVTSPNIDLSSASNYLLQEGDILFARTGASVGKTYIYEKMDGKVYYAGFLIRARINARNNPIFIFQNTLTSNYNQFIQLTSQRSGQPGVNAQEYANYSLMLPTPKEQDAIGVFLKKLDDIISIQQQELNTLKQTKQGFLQKMFPQEGKNVPEFRLPGFTEEWCETNIGAIADIVRGSSPRPIQNPKWFDQTSEVGWLRISDVTEQNGRIHNLEQRISLAGQEKTRVVSTPHLLLSIAATVGKPVINYVKTGVHDGFLIFLNPAFDLEFMFQWLEMFRPKWQKYGQPGSQVNLNSELVRHQEIYLPDIKEQIKIGEFFNQLDKIVELHEQELEALKETKKAFLQKMFV